MSELTTQQILEKLYFDGDYGECMDFNEFVNRFGPAILERYGKEKASGK